jgi:hypothetical protein
MRRRPLLEKPEVPQRIERGRPPPVTDRNDIVNPFLVSGGQTYFIVDDDNNFDPRPDGVQMLCFAFVPKGYVGFVKELRVAPFCPPVFNDPWTTVGTPQNTIFTSWRDWDSPPPDLVPGPRAVSTNSVWTTPFGWESYFGTGADDFPPRWRWHLRIIEGNITALRARAPAFNPADPATWFLLESLPVPRAGYGSGIPGQPAGSQWGAQRMQVLQGDKLSSHVPVPPGHSVALFVEWTQRPIAPVSRYHTDEGDGRDTYGPATYPLLPSFGQLHGYMQAMGDTDTTTENGLFGWGG